MHKTFYASGFIYHLPTQKILLQQAQHPNSLWTLFEKEYTENVHTDQVFKSIIRNRLGITIDTVKQIYFYYNETTKKNQSLLYATIDKLQEFKPKDGFIFQWFTFKEVLKIQATAQTKHDIVVGQRVIEAAGRKDRGEHTFQ